MAKSVWQRYIEDENGIVPGATITVRKQFDNSIATIFSDDIGTAKANPFSATAAGLARFYANAGVYKITAVDGLFSSEFEDVQLGNSQSLDVANASGSLMTRAQMDTRYVLQGGSISQIINTAYFTTQNPTGTNAPMQIIWSNADIITADINVLGAANATPVNRGKINFLAAGQFVVELTVSMSRTGAGGFSKLILVFRENGVNIASEVVAFLTSDEENAVYKSTTLADITAPTTWTMDLVRDSTGDNSGGLVQFDPALGGLPNVPGARLKIWKLK